MTDKDNRNTPLGLPDPRECPMWLRLFVGWAWTTLGFAMVGALSVPSGPSVMMIGSALLILIPCVAGLFWVTGALHWIAAREQSS